MNVFGGGLRGAVDMKMLKSVGESEEPCGTPWVGEKECVDNVLSALMLICLCEKKVNEFGEVVISVGV